MGLVTATRGFSLKDDSQGAMMAFLCDDLSRKLAPCLLLGDSGLDSDMSIHVWESDELYQVIVVVPGVDQAGMAFSIRANEVWIRANCRREAHPIGPEQDQGKCCYRSAFRAFTLPTYIVASRVEVEYQNELLKLSLPKKGTRATARS